MPKKRRTKVTVTSSKEPATPDKGHSSENEQRRRKLNIYIKDFDMKVDSCLIQADHEAKTLCDAINLSFNMELLKLPKHIREMTMGQFMAQGGSIDKSVSKQVTDVIDSMSSTIATKTLKVLEESTYTKTVSTTTKRKAVTGRNNMKNSTAAPLTQSVRRSARKTTRSQFATPAFKPLSKDSNANWNTPMITPKFDPRLPVTPATCIMRNMRKGETIISLAGSPLSNPANQSSDNSSIPQATIPLADGSTLRIGTNSPLVDITMDSTTRSNIVLLQNNLARLLKKFPITGDV